MKDRDRFDMQELEWRAILGTVTLPAGSTTTVEDLQTGLDAQDIEPYEKAESPEDLRITPDELSENDEYPESSDRRGAVTLEGQIIKVDKAQRLVFGWFSITEIDGRTIEDVQQDMISPETLERACYQFVLDSRQGGEMHEKMVGRLVESCCFTREKQQAMMQSLNDQGINATIDLRCTAWWGGFFVESPEAWEGVTSGRLKAFSIGGKAKREKRD